MSSPRNADPQDAGGKPLITSTTSDADAVLPRQTFARRFGKFDTVLMVLALVLAFFLGSFAAHTTEVYLHLGLGSPFGANADESGWVHHAWLTSWLLGLLYQPYTGAAETGGAWAVAVKALLVVALALVMMRISRRGESRIVPILCTALAIVVMSPRLGLHPLLVSLVFLGITLWVLMLPAALHPRAIWWLLTLFVLWVNMDQWFLLGPLTVALWLCGEWLLPMMARTPHRTNAADKERKKQLALVLAAATLGCLINPWLHRAFTLPMEVGYLFSGVLPVELTGTGLMVDKVQQSDPQFVPQFSPFSPEYFSRATVGQNTAGLAYFVLLAVGVVFVWLRYVQSSRFEDALRRQGTAAVGESDKLELDGARAESPAAPLIVVFIFFAVLSAWNYRFIPFFAVVAGPMAAIVIQDFLRLGRITSARVSKFDFNWAYACRAGALGVFLTLLVCAWAGWLHAYSDDWRATRHVAWSVVEDPGVVTAAKVIQEVRQKTGLCKVGFCYSPEGGNLFVPCGLQRGPGTQLICDSRFSLHVAQAEGFGKIRKALRDEAEAFFQPGTRQGKERQDASLSILDARAVYQKWLREMGIDFVVLTKLPYDPQAQRIAHLMVLDPAPIGMRQWVLLYHDGHTAVFGWIDPVSPATHSAFVAYQQDTYRLTTPTSMPPNVPRVPLVAEGVPPEPANTSGDLYGFLYGPPKRARSSLQSSQFMALFEKAGPNWQRGVVDTLVAATGAVCPVASNLAFNLPVAKLKDAKGNEVQQPLFLPRDSGPPNALLLAVRSARNATWEAPDDFYAYWNLAQAYQLLQGRQEDYWGRWPPMWQNGPYKLGLRHQLRLIQTVTAYHNALAIQPDNQSVHEALHELYLGVGYLDLAVDHLIQARHALELRKPADRDQAKAIKQLQEGYDQRVKMWTAELKQRHDDFKADTTEQQDVVTKFDKALVDRKKKFRDPLGREQPGARGLVKLGMEQLQTVDLGKLKNDPGKQYFIASWELYLLLTTGRAREAFDLLNDELMSFKGGEYEQLRMLAAAALGDYAQADKTLDKAEKARKLPADAQIIEGQKKATRQLLEVIGSTVGWAPGGTDGFVGPASRLGASNLAQLELIAVLLQQVREKREVAELRFVRGLLALEMGDTDAAAVFLRGSLDILPPLLPVGLEFTEVAIARRYLELLK